MNWKVDWSIFFSTFGLIFLAELGDKTQLTAFAISADSRSSWSVFLGAAVAFIISAAFAVILGMLLRRAVPLQWVQLAAGLLFLIFGALTLITAMRSFKRQPVVIELPSTWPAVSTLALDDFGGDLGAVSRFVLGVAVDFESRAVGDYQEMGRLARSREVAGLFDWLSQADSLHHRVVSALAEHNSKAKILHSDDLAKSALASVAIAAEAQETTPAIESNIDSTVERPMPKMGAVKAAGDFVHDLHLLEQAEQHEISSYSFYTDLASKFSKFKVAGHFSRLAVEELQHLQKIRQVKEKITASGNIS